MLPINCYFGKFKEIVLVFGRLFKDWLSSSSICKTRSLGKNDWFLTLVVMRVVGTGEGFVVKVPCQNRMKAKELPSRSRHLCLFTYNFAYNFKGSWTCQQTILQGSFPPCRRITFFTPINSVTDQSKVNRSPGCHSWAKDLRAVLSFFVHQSQQ